MNWSNTALRLDLFPLNYQVVPLGAFGLFREDILDVRHEVADVLAAGEWWRSRTVVDAPRQG